MKLDERMKRYENAYRFHLTPRTPLIIRVDGKAFHTYTKQFQPFSDVFSKAMEEVAKNLLNNVEGAKLVFTQSDEISLLLTDYNTFKTQSWFDNNLQKIVSVSASMATYYFNKFMESVSEKPAFFDSRVFNIPIEEINNYFVWRQKDCMRNSIQMLGRMHFSQKELHEKNTTKIKEMLIEKKNIIWEKDLPEKFRSGIIFLRDEEKSKTFLFSENANIVEELLKREE